MSNADAAHQQAAVIEDLQMRLTYQEDELKQLNQAVIRQQAELDALRRTLVTLNERLAAYERPSPTATHEPPPHY